MPTSFRAIRNLGLAVMVLLIIVMGLIPSLVMSRISRPNTMIVRELFELHRIIQINNLYRESKKQFDRFTRREEKDIALTINAIDRAIDASRAFEKLVEEEEEEEELMLIRSFIGASKRFKTSAAAYGEEVVYDPAGSTAIEMEEVVINTETETYMAFSKIMDNIQTDIEDSRIAFTNEIKSSQQLSTIGLIIGIMAGIMIAFLMARALNRPIQQLLEGTRRIARGDFTQKLNIETKDEIGALGQAFDRMTEELEKVRTQVMSAKDYTESIIQNMINSLIVLTPDGKIQKVNKAACRLLGYNEAELVGRHFDSVLTKEEVANGGGFDSLINRAAIRNAEKEYMSKEGKKIWVLFSASAVSVANGEIKSVICAAQDITERKKMEDEMKKNLEDLKLFKETTIGRENVMIELKKEVNKLSQELGRPAPYDMSFLE